MCPISELPEHDIVNPSAFENDERGQFQPSLAVKAFHRSDAGRAAYAHQLRPIRVLKQTLTHLIDVVIGRMAGTSPARSALNMYHYVRDRFRAIRQDMIYQDCHGTDAIAILEPIALFHVGAGLRFAFLPRYDFDPVQNKEQLTQTLLTLDSEYDVYHTPNEAFFRTLHLLVYISDADFLSRMMAFSRSLLNSLYVKSAVDLRGAFLRHAFLTFLEIPKKREWP
jgi:hypothetical protein